MNRIRKWLDWHLGITRCWCGTKLKIISEWQYDSMGNGEFIHYWCESCETTSFGSQPPVPIGAWPRLKCWLHEKRVLK